MKINWFSPLPPEKTDIGNFSLRIVPHLLKYAEITIYTEQKHWDTSIDRLCQVKHCSSIKWLDLNNGITIYNIGNNPFYHAKAWEISTAHPGIVILHDYHLHHLFGGIFREQRRDEKSYFDVMRRYYGLNGYDAARKFWSSDSIDYMSEHFPLGEYARENALGVIVHSNYAFEKIAVKNRWPIALIPLPYPSTIGSEALLTHIKNRLDTAQSTCRLILFGYLGSNRRVESILKAIAEVRASSNYLLDIYGELSNKKHIEKKIAELNLQKHVKIHGFVCEEKLDSVLNQAHLAINLRYPTMGEASGTQLRIWNHALPSIVTKAGWYAELPDDTVRFVRPEYETKDIIAALRDFAENPECFMQMGKNGKKYLEQWHDTDTYTQAIIRFAQEVYSSVSGNVAYILADG